MKKCTKCKKRKNLNDFSKHPKGKFGTHPQCKFCRSEYEKKRYLNSEKEKRKIFKPYTYEKQLKSQYGLTLNDFKLLRRKQNYRCAICKQYKKLVVDHNHKNGIVRGLLCTKCNTGLGKFNDDSKQLKIAIKYLEGWSSGL